MIGTSSTENRTFALLASLLAFICIGLVPQGPALAQGIPSSDVTSTISPIVIQEDIAGLNLASGKIASEGPMVSIPAAPRLHFNRVQNAAPFSKGEEHENFCDGCVIDGDWVVQTIEGTSEAFHCEMTTDGFGCTDKHGSGSGFKKSGRYYTQKGSAARYYFGATHLYTIPANNDPYPKWLRYFYATTVSFPDGEVLSYQYDTATLANDPYGRTFYRPARITTNLGYYMEIEYQGQVLGQPGWGKPAKVSIFAQSDAVNPLARLTYAADGSATDLKGRTYQGVDPGDMGMPTETTSFSLTLPGLAAPSVAVTERSYTYQENGQNWTVKAVGSIKRDGVTYNYQLTNPRYTSALNDITFDAVTVTGPAGYSAQYQVSLEGNRQAIGLANRIKSATDSSGNITQYQYDGSGRLTTMIAPELNAVAIEYDAAGNIVKKTTTAKPGSSLAPLIEQLFVDLSAIPTIDGALQCDNHVMCWRPAWVKDALLNRTEFTWTDEGLLASQLDPADSYGVRRKVKNEWTKNAQNVWRLTREEICEADSAGNEVTCGTNKSRLKVTSYWNNTFLPQTETVSDGIGGNPATTTYDYDSAGRLLSKDGPLPGTDDAVYYRYDLAGRKTWEIGPKGEAGYRQATRLTLRDADDQPEKVETGRISSPTDTNLVVLTTHNTSYDTNRLVRAMSSSGSGAVTTITNVNYDARNREQCRAVRMVGPSTSWDACTLMQETLADGTIVTDRVTRTYYDTESRPTKVVQAYGTTLQRDYATYSYTANGKTASMTDARGYRAEMRYDGFDRQNYWYFPHPQVTGTINTADYEQYGYDANGNRTSQRKRDGSTITYAYDNLNRLRTKTVPEKSGLAAVNTRDVWYSYDVFGQTIRTTFDNAWGEGPRITYDPLGRPTKDSYYDGTSTYFPLTYTYDAANNRTSIKYPDGQQFTYLYTSGGQFDYVRDPSSNTLFNFNYDNNGRLQTLVRNATAPDQSFGYDGLSRLTSTGWSDAGSNSVTWGYTRNRASQILTETQSNDSYSWESFAATDTAYVANGLNQYTTVATKGFCYDPNGNLTADDTMAYLYDVENRLVEMRSRVGTSCPAAYTGQLKAKLLYDPLGRLRSVENYINGVAQGTTLFLHDGDALVAESNASGTMLARYIHGPAVGADDPMISYAGSSVALSNARFLYADSRGSIVLRSSSSGTDQVKQSYDPYGIPSAGHATFGRFGYTGQVWLEELGMNYYKARMYSPRLSRYMQTDPIGYDDDSNLYAYVGDDPVNKADYDGLEAGSCYGPTLCNSISSTPEETKFHHKVLWATFDAGLFAFGPEVWVARGGLMLARSLGLSSYFRFTLASGKLVQASRYVLWQGVQPTLRAGEFTAKALEGWTRQLNAKLMKGLIAAGEPIRDSVVDAAGSLAGKEVLENGARTLLGQERKMLRDAGWKFSQKTGLWTGPKEAPIGSRIRR